MNKSFGIFGKFNCRAVSRTRKSKGLTFFSAPGGFRLIQVLEVWILGIVNVSRDRQVSVMLWLRLRQF